MKYVIVLNNLGGEEPILFCDSLDDRDFKHMNPIRAGYWDIDAGGKAHTYGEITSLGLYPGEDDSRLIDRALRMAKGWGG